MKKFDIKIKSFVLLITILFLSYITQSFAILGQAPDFETEHKVTEGDTLAKLSYYYYSLGDRLRGAHWIHIYAYSLEKKYLNPNNQNIKIIDNNYFVRIYPGQKLAIPFFEEDYPPVSELFKEYNKFIKDLKLTEKTDKTTILNKIKLSYKKQNTKQEKKDPTTTLMNINSPIINNKEDIESKIKQIKSFNKYNNSKSPNLSVYIPSYEDRAFIDVNISSSKNKNNN